MDLNKILSKTKQKSEQIKNVRQPPNIAMEDRPYSIDEIQLGKKLTSFQQKSLYKNRQQIDNKPTTNWQQNNNKLTTNRQQIDDKNVQKISNRQQTDNKPTTKLTTELATNRQQIDNKSTTNRQQNYPFSSLVGLQRKLIIFIYYECKNSRSKVTESITLEHISTSLKCSKGAAKTTLQRLETKGFVIRKEFKIGRGGWSKYELSEDTYREVLILETDNKLATNRQQIGNKLTTKPATESATISLSSSSDLYIKTTTTDEANSEKSLDNFEEWKKLDLEPLIEVGFSQTHLFQIAKQNLLEPTAVQESIYAFSFDLKNNGKAKLLKKSPIDFFMGILRNGSVYAPPSNYKSPKETALEAFINKQNCIQELEGKAVKISFENWVSKMTLNEKNAIVPEETRKTGVSGLINQALRAHFRETIWPKMREEIMKKSLV